MIKFVILAFLSLCLYSKDFTVASYNVENLFDLKKQNTEYKEYIPNSKSNWNKRNFNKKLNNVIKVIKDIDADIIALQEIENKQLLKLISKEIPSYKYISFTKYKNSSVGLGFLSKIKIISNNQINVKFSKKTFRPILETTFKINNIKFKIFNNHWPSKRVYESYRIKYAKKLYDRLKELPRDFDYILLGDFNSNYNEYETFKYNKKLNNSTNITGINQVLNTTLNSQFNTYIDMLETSKRVHYNLWLEVNPQNRFSTKFRNQNNTPDNIIIPPALLDNKKISYVPNSFKVFKPEYLYKNNKINRWKFYQKYNTKLHKGIGYSDHLPIIASFSSTQTHKNYLKNIKTKDSKALMISDLYTMVKLNKPVEIKDAVVIYKHKDNAIIKQKNNRAIFIYKKAKKLLLGHNYDLKINQIKDYHGLKEIVDFEILNKKDKIAHKSLYLNANNINILDPKYQNEIIENLKGKVKNKKLYFNNQVIKIYSKNKDILPTNGQTITIKNAHLGIYKGNMQIVINKKTDYKIEN